MCTLLMLVCISLKPCPLCLKKVDKSESALVFQVSLQALHSNNKKQIPIIKTEHNRIIFQLVGGNKLAIWVRDNQETNPNSYQSRDSNLGPPDCVSELLITWLRTSLSLGYSVQRKCTGLLRRVGLTPSTRHVEWRVSQTNDVRVSFCSPYYKTSSVSQLNYGHRKVIFWGL